MLSLEEILKEKDKTNEHLTKISFNNCKLHDVSIISTLKNIQIISLNNNQITNLKFCKNLLQLSQLFMENNRIFDLKEIDNLENCNKLHTVNLKGNPIQINYKKLYMSKIKNTVKSIQVIDGFKIILEKHKLDLFNIQNNSNLNTDSNSNLCNKKKTPSKVYSTKNVINKNNFVKLINNSFGEEKNINNSQINSLESIIKQHGIRFKSNDKANKKRGETPNRNCIDIKINKIVNRGLNSANAKINSRQNSNIYNSVVLLLNELNLDQLKQMKEFVDNKIEHNIYSLHTKK